MNNSQEAKKGPETKDHSTGSLLRVPKCGPESEYKGRERALKRKSEVTLVTSAIYLLYSSLSLPTSSRLEVF